MRAIEIMVKASVSIAAGLIAYGVVSYLSDSGLPIVSEVARRIKEAWPLIAFISGAVTAANILSDIFS